MFLGRGRGGKDGRSLQESGSTQVQGTCFLKTICSASKLYIERGVVSENAEDRAKIYFPFLFGISGFPYVGSPIGLLCLGAPRGSYGQRPPKISLLRRTEPPNSGALWD